MENIIYLIGESSQLEYARFSHVGTWTAGKLCGSCGQPTSKLVEPLQIEWDRGSTQIGDFSWCGYTAVVNEKVRGALLSKKFRSDFGCVEIIEGKNANRKVGQAIEWHCLYWLIPRDIVEINIERSGVTLEVDCSVCMRRKYGFKSDGLIVNKDSLLDGVKIFTIKQFDRSAAMFVTQLAKEELLNFGFTNIEFTEAGRIV